MVRSGFTFTRPMPIEFRSSAARQNLAPRRRLDACGPQDRVGLDTRGACGRRVRHALRIDRGHTDRRYDRTPKLTSWRLGGGRKTLGKCGQHTRRSIEQQNPRLLGMNRAEIVTQGIVWRSRPERRRVRRPWAPRRRSRKSASAGGLRIGLALGGFERVENLVPNASRVFEGLEAGRDGFPRVVAEIEVARARSDDQ